MKPQLNSWAAFEMWKFSLSTPTVVPGYSLSTRNSASSSLRRRLSAAVASNDTALAQAAVSGYFIRRVRHFGQRPQTGKHWLKWLDVVDVERQPILAQQARQAPWNDYATWPVLIASTHQDTPLGWVLADAEAPLQTQSYLPGATLGSQRHSGQTPLYLQGIGYASQIEESFPTELYGRRSLVESVFSAVRRNHIQSRQALLLDSS